MKPADTAPKIKKYHDALCRNLSMEERFIKGLQWIQASRVLMLAGIRARHPHFTEEEIRKKLLQDLYS